MDLEVVGGECVEGLVTDDRGDRREILLEALEQSEEIHVRVDVDALDRAEAVVAENETVEAAR
jgi:hypothetical protein